MAAATVKGFAIHALKLILGGGGAPLSPSHPDQPLHPRKGDRYYLRSGDGDPWPLKKYPPVTVLDVKDGWVRYRISDIFSDERMKLEVFEYCYGIDP